MFQLHLEAVYSRYLAFSIDGTASQPVPFSTHGCNFSCNSTVMLQSSGGDIMFMYQLLAFIGGIVSIYHGIAHCKTLEFYYYAIQLLTASSIVLV